MAKLKAAEGKIERSATVCKLGFCELCSPLLGYQGNVLKLKASPEGIARMTSAVIAQLKAYGPMGVPNGFVDAQKFVQGKTPCLPHSRIIRAAPMEPDTMLPNALSAIKKFSPFTRVLFPRTLLNQRLAVVSSEFSRSYFETPAYHDTFVSMLWRVFESQQSSFELVGVYITDS